MKATFALSLLSNPGLGDRFMIARAERLTQTCPPDSYVRFITYWVAIRY